MEFNVDFSDKLNANSRILYTTCFLCYERERARENDDCLYYVRVKRKYASLLTSPLFLSNVSKISAFFFRHQTKWVSRQMSTGPWGANEVPREEKINKWFDTQTPVGYATLHSSHGWKWKIICSRPVFVKLCVIAK